MGLVAWLLVPLATGVPLVLLLLFGEVSCSLSSSELSEEEGEMDECTEDTGDNVSELRSGDVALVRLRVCCCVCLTLSGHERGVLGCLVICDSGL